MSELCSQNKNNINKRGDVGFNSHQTNNELIELQGLWERIFHFIPGLVMVIDKEFRIIRANKAMAERLGCRPDEILGLKCYQVVHGLNEPVRDCPHAKLLKTQKAHTLERYEEKLEGIFNISVSPLFGKDGNLIGSVHIASDITEHKKSRDVLDRINNELKKKIEIQDLKLSEIHEQLFLTIQNLRRVESELKEHLRFETVVTEISTDFINFPFDKIEKELPLRLKRLGELLKVDGCIMGFRPESTNSKHFRIFSWVKEDVKIHPVDMFDISEFGWLYGRLLKGKRVCFSKVTDLPSKAVKERKHWKEKGIKSAVLIPLSVENDLAGFIAFFTVKRELTWSATVKKRMDIIGNMFSNLVVRLTMDRSLYKAFEEIKELKEKLEAERIVLEEEIKLEHGFDRIIGNSVALKYVLNRVEQVAPLPTTVLILGETGTGKELIARAIHERSPRRDRPFIKVNCATLPANLIESELFGHEKHAFTGAGARKIGRFEVADGSTLFLDEIGELPLELQAKLLRVLQEGAFERLGSNKTITVDVRIIAATNRDLEAEVAKGRFRKDLWYRLNVFPITMPPLRNRKEDIPLLVNHFVKQFSRKMGKRIQKIPSRVMNKLISYDWPGNIRELENIIERAVIVSKGEVLELMDDLEPQLNEHRPLRTLDEVERDYIVEVLNKTGWKIEGKNGAAEILGLNPSTLRGRMRKLGIKRPKNNIHLI